MVAVVELVVAVVVVAIVADVVAAVVADVVVAVVHVTFQQSQVIFFCPSGHQQLNDPQCFIFASLPKSERQRLLSLNFLLFWSRSYKIILLVYYKYYQRVKLNCVIWHV